VQRRQDEAVQQAIAAGSFSRLTPEEGRRSRKRAALKREARRKAEALGLDLAELRRGAGLTQAELATLIGTQRTDISRLESGRYGGLTVDRLVAILAAVKGASGLPWEEILRLLGGGRTVGFSSVAETIM